MTTAEMLTAVKKALNITGTYQDDALTVYIEEVTSFLVGCGIPSASITVGIVARGVSDLWNYGAGEGQLSEYFYTRAKQLALNAKG